MSLVFDNKAGLFDPETLFGLDEAAGGGGSTLSVAGSATIATSSTAALRLAAIMAGAATIAATATGAGRLVASVSKSAAVSVAATGAGRLVCGVGGSAACTHLSLGELALVASCVGTGAVFFLPSANLYAPVDPGDWTRPSRTGRRWGRRR